MKNPRVVIAIVGLSAAAVAGGVAVAATAGGSTHRSITPRFFAGNADVGRRNHHSHGQGDRRWLDRDHSREWQGPSPLHLQARHGDSLKGRRGAGRAVASVDRHVADRTRGHRHPRRGAHPRTDPRCPTTATSCTRSPRTAPVKSRAKASRTSSWPPPASRQRTAVSPRPRLQRQLARPLRAAATATEPVRRRHPGAPRSHERPSESRVGWCRRWPIQIGAWNVKRAIA